MKIPDLSITELQTLAQGLGIEYEGMSKEELKQSIIADITIYSKEGCPYCDKAKSFLKRRGMAFNTINVTPEMKERVMQEIRRNTGKAPPGTFPVIVQGSRFIGGSDELEAAFGEKSTCMLL